MRTSRLDLALVLGILVTPLAADAQPGKVARVGVLMNAVLPPSYVEAFRQGLRARGWVEGQTIALEWRSADARFERLPDLAAELVALRVDVLVTGANPGVAAAKRVSTTLPIVFVGAVNPVESGFVASIPKPGGNITGLSFSVTPELVAKRLQLFKEAVPTITRVAVLWNSAVPGLQPNWQAAQAAGRALGLTLYPAEVRAPDDLEKAFAAVLRERPEALWVWADAVLTTHRRRVIDFAAKNRLPTMSPLREYAEDGGLMAHGVSLPDLYRRAAGYVDKVLGVDPDRRFDVGEIVPEWCPPLELGDGKHEGYGFRRNEAGDRATRRR